MEEFLHRCTKSAKLQFFYVAYIFRHTRTIRMQTNLEAISINNNVIFTIQ